MGNGLSILRSPHTPGNVLQLNSGWSRVFGTAARPIFDLAYLDELQTTLSILTNNYFEQFVSIRGENAVTIPPLEYRQKFDADLHDAARLADDERRTMPLRLENSPGLRKHWRIICELFTQNGKVVRRSGPITGIFFKRWKMTRSNFDRAVCKYRNDKLWHPWRPSAKGAHLVSNSDKSYSLAW